MVNNVRPSELRGRTSANVAGGGISRYDRSRELKVVRGLSLLTAQTNSQQQCDTENNSFHGFSFKIQQVVFLTAHDWSRRTMPTATFAIHSTTKTTSNTSVHVSTRGVIAAQPNQPSMI